MTKLVETLADALGTILPEANRRVCDAVRTHRLGNIDRPGHTMTSGGAATPAAREREL